jgi:23S rRNA (pseudouridine1915-N3)-methyltransferase
MFKVSLVAMGTKMPSWVEAASKEYIKRLREYASLNLIELPLEKRGKTGATERLLDKEAERMIQRLPKDAKIIALEIEGQSFDSPALADELNQVKMQYSHICFLIGGPEGLHPKILKHCHGAWSLSKLTLAHPMVRVILLESLYRAFSISANHPYHK